MNELIRNSAFFAVALTLFAYEIGIFLKKKLKLAVFNPLLVAIVLVIAVVLCLKLDYKEYQANAQMVSGLLTPATVCLAIPLYEQISMLKQHYKAILAGIFAGAVASLGSVLALSVLFGLTHEEYVTILPKSITTAIGMGVSEELGGIVTITVASIILTGILGNVIGEQVFKLFKIEEPVAKGVALGTSAHAIGTAKAMEIGELEGAMSSLSIAVAGVITVALASIFALFY